MGDRAFVVSAYAQLMDLGYLGEIDRDSGELLYRQIANLLADRIGTAVLPWGSVLPSSPEMAAHYGVSTGPVQKALRALARDGLVVVRQGAATRVREEPPQA